MGFKVLEYNGNWGVFSDNPSQSVSGLSIDKENYDNLRDEPHLAANHFTRRGGKLLKKKTKSA